MKKMLKVSPSPNSKNIKKITHLHDGSEKCDWLMGDFERPFTYSAGLNNFGFLIFYTILPKTCHSLTPTTLKKNTYAPKNVANNIYVP